MANSAEKLGMTQDEYNEIKREVVKSLIYMLHKDLLDPKYDADQKESIIVAKQCLEVAYEIDADKIQDAVDVIQLFHLQNLPAAAQTSKTRDEVAETYKVLGNESMKQSKYDEAIQHYTKACEINPEKAIFFCNRAAAYSHLYMYKESVQDCKEAIKLDPTYSKAYARLGTAYSNQQKFKDAAVAYKTALQLDPTNLTYQANLKLAEDNVLMNQTPPLSPFGLNFAGMMTNPAQILGDPSFRDIVNGIMTNVPTVGEPNMQTFVQVGQHLADQIRIVSNSGLDDLHGHINGDTEADQQNQYDQNPSNGTP